MQKQLIICPTCNSVGTKAVLGEMTSEGNFRIMRFHRSYTDVFGKDFGVKCGNCGENVFIRKESVLTQINISSFVLGTLETI